MLCMRNVNKRKPYSSVKNLPDIRVSLDVEVVEIICVLHLAKVRTLKSLNDFCLHYPGNMSR